MAEWNIQSRTNLIMSCVSTAGRIDLKIGPEAIWKVDAKVWSDPTTKLPVRLEIRSAEADGEDFVMVLVGREPDRLGLIIANPFDAASLTRSDFPGQTDKGIRMGSSRQDVRDAYGEPDAPLPGDRGRRSDVLRYEKLGIMFGFTAGKVQQIILSR